MTFWPSIDSKATDTFKAQKGSKGIIKIVHVTSVDHPQWYEATRILFVCKENKTKKRLYSTMSDFDACSWEYHHACAFLCLKTSRRTRMHCGLFRSCECGHVNVTHPTMILTMPLSWVSHNMGFPENTQDSFLLKKTYNWMNLYVSIWWNVLQNALSEELANMKKIQDDLLVNKVFFSLNYNAIVKD